MLIEIEITNNLKSCRDWIERVCKLVGQYGDDFWWELPIKKLLGKKMLAELNINDTDLEKGQVIYSFDKLLSEVL